MGVLQGSGVGAGGSERGAEIGGAKDSPGADGGGSEAAASASASLDQLRPCWSSSALLCFFASIDLFFLRAFLAFFLAAPSSSSCLAFFLAARSSSVIVRMSVAP